MGNTPRKDFLATPAALPRRDGSNLYHMACSLLSLVVLLGVIAGLLLGGWGFTAGRVKEACCAACGYLAAGLPLVRCPECGDDWATRGVRQPGARILLRPSAEMRFLCRTLLLGLVAVPTYWHLQDTYSRYNLLVYCTGHSPTGLFSSLRVRALGTCDRAKKEWKTPLYKPVLVLHGAKGEATLRVLDSRLRAEVTSPDGNSTRTTDKLEAVDVRRFMSAAGLDESRQDFDATADELLLLITNLAVGGNVPGSTQDNRAASSVPITFAGFGEEQWRMLTPRILIPFVAGTLAAWVLLCRGLLWSKGTKKKMESGE